FYAVIPPFILGRSVDFFTKHEQGDSLRTFYWYVVVLITSGVLLIVRSISKQQLLAIRNAAYRRIRTESFQSLAGLEFKNTQNSSVGVKAQKIENGMASLKVGLSILENRIFETVAIFIGVAGVFFFLQPKYVLFFIAYSIIFGILLVLYYKKIQQCNYRRNIAKEDASGIFIEGLNNILSLKVFNAEKTFKKVLEQKEKKSEAIGNEEASIIITQWRWFHVLNSISIGLFLLLMGVDVVNQVVTVGVIVVVFAYFDKLVLSAHKVIGLYQEFIGAKNGVARMMPIFWEKDNKRGCKAGKKFPKDWSSIKIENAKFTYKKEEQDKFHTGIKSINFEVKKYGKVGLVGKTGSGKSTLAKLLVGLYSIDKGKYSIGGKNFYNIKSESILENISIVLQESEMFNLSLRDNITLMHKFDEELFSKAIDIAQLREVIERLPKRENTFIGEKGYHLSGGERQRIGIARAIYRDTQIMIFDEATSSLDNNTEALIQGAIESELKKKTLIFIAHRITTLENVDKIYVFKNGKIVESGNYQELLNNSKSEFHRLAKKK
ncbi:MAG TPA: ABC transporter ATP-binding protein, partial [Lutibacter sp.]|nr:ABC transporter ATP-binding protein [Lutibacter sp.]